MLCQFTVKNFKSIRDEATLDLQAATISEHTDHLLVGQTGEQFLPVSAIYGPNGGGKSNVLAALRALKHKVLNPVRAASSKEPMGHSGEATIAPFAFSLESRSSATEFEIFFQTEMAEYRYILHVQKDEVVLESLDRIKFDTRRKSGLYHRDASGITLIGSFKQLQISEDLSQTLPLLSYLGIAYGKNEVVRDVISWFVRGIVFFDYGNPLHEIMFRVPKSDRLRKISLNLMREMDLGIDDFRIEERDNDNIEVFTQHTIDGLCTWLSLSEESSGTKKIFSLLQPIVIALQSGAVLVVDELDAKLHPLLLRHIIQLFCDRDINRAGAQLVFTSHDLATMTSEIFRRDEIWFVAKGNQQNSKLYSLVEFKTESGEAVRKDAKFDKQYLEGKYGADPYLRRLVTWEDLP